MSTPVGKVIVIAPHDDDPEIDEAMRVLADVVQRKGVPISQSRLHGVDISRLDYLIDEIVGTL